MRISWRLGLGRIESVDYYAGVLVPLEEAHLHSHSARTGKVEFEARNFAVGDDEDEIENGSAKDEDSEREGMLEMDAAEYTIEGLRKEMREGRRGQWSEYESEWPHELSTPNQTLIIEQSNPNSSTRPSKILAWVNTTGSYSCCAALAGLRISKQCPSPLSILSQANHHLAAYGFK